MLLHNIRHAQNSRRLLWTKLFYFSGTWETMLNTQNPKSHKWSSHRNSDMLSPYRRYLTVHFMYDTDVVIDSASQEL